jgi:cell wall-associated NlpC family hydrolase
MRPDIRSLAVSGMLLGALTLFSAFFLSCAPSRTVKPAPGKERAVQQEPDRLKKIVDSYLGVPYKTGGMNRRGFDCSGFVVTVFREYSGERLPRSTRELKRVGRTVSKNDARPGDLVFVKGGMFGSINHVGIYMGNGAFVHASSSHGVRYDRLDDEYYTKHFAMIRRIF